MRTVILNFGMDVKTFASISESFVKTAAIIFGALWAYWKFVRQRANEPATDMDVDVKFVGKQGGQWIIEITVTLANKSQVQLAYDNFQITARYLLPGDAIEDGEHKIHHQMKCPRTIDDRIGGEKRYFSNTQYINPKQEFRHRYVTFIPEQATFLWLQAKFLFDLKGTVKIDGQRIFRAPQD